MNAINRRVSRLEGQLARRVDNEPRDEHGRTTAMRIWEARRSRLTKEELILEERKIAVLREACRGHRTIAEAIWRGQAALKNFAKMEAGHRMIARTLARRLERLEAELAPPDDGPALRILVTSPGQPDQIIEVHESEPVDRRRRPRDWNISRGR